MRTLSSITEIISKYEYFILDLWGTLHNGKAFFPEVLPFLTTLKNNHKTIMFISNSPRQKKYFIEDLKDVSINLSAFGDKITAGELFLNDFKYNSALNKPFYFMGSDSLKTELLERIAIDYFQPIEKAGYLLCASLIQNYEEILEKSLAQKLPLVCINPDLYVIENGQKKLRPGTAAQFYEFRGGQVIYFGKPYPFIFDEAFKLMKSPQKSNVLFIGDSLYTDIKGAKNYGIDSLLVNTGIHFTENTINPWERVDYISEHYDIFPTYRITRLH